MPTREYRTKVNLTVRIRFEVREENIVPARVSNLKLAIRDSLEFGKAAGVPTGVNADSIEVEVVDQQVSNK